MSVGSVNVADFPEEKKFHNKATKAAKTSKPYPQDNRFKLSVMNPFVAFVALL
jgi:hypothetical protein